MYIGTQKRISRATIIVGVGGTATYIHIFLPIKCAALQKGSTSSIQSTDIICIYMELLLKQYIIKLIFSVFMLCMRIGVTDVLELNAQLFEISARISIFN